MPTVFREHGFAVRIYLPPREHSPPQVHVVRTGGEVKIHLGTESARQAWNASFKCAMPTL
jgi:hypothetical protein